MVIEQAASGRPVRQRNRRGEGHRLRDEILAAALSILERTGTEEAVTLRGIAREVGISAPSVTIHFADRAEIVDEVVALQGKVLGERVRAADRSSDDPVQRFHAVTEAYVAYGREQPGRYRVLFERRYIADWEATGQTMPESSPLVAELLAVPVATLGDCVAAGRSASDDVVGDTVATWFFLHGLVALPASITSLPWPDLDALRAEGVTRLARLTD